MRSTSGEVRKDGSCGSFRANCPDEIGRCQFLFMRFFPSTASADVLGEEEHRMHIRGSAGFPSTALLNDFSRRTWVASM